MSLTIWVYHRQAEGRLVRFSARRYERFAEGEEPLSELAGTDALFVGLVVELDNRRPVQIMQITFSRHQLDATGHIDEKHRNEVLAAISGVMQAEIPIGLGTATDTSNVISIRKPLARQRLERVSAFKPSFEDFVALAEKVNSRAGRSLLAAVGGRLHCLSPVDKVAMPSSKSWWQPSPLPGQMVLVTTIDPAGEPHVATQWRISMVAPGPPPILMLACGSGESTTRNALARGEFVVNIPSQQLAEATARCGTYPAVYGRERFSELGLSPIPAAELGPPRIAECRAHLECRTERHVELGSETAIFANVVAVTIDRRALEGDIRGRYRLLAPIFRLEGDWAATLGGASQAGLTTGPKPAQMVLQILAVSDLKFSDHFYRGAFGWPIRVETQDYIEYELPDGRGLGLYRLAGFGRNIDLSAEAIMEGEVSGTELYFHVDDLEAAMTRIEKAGAQCMAERKAQAWGDETAYYTDPDGNVLVVAKPIGT